MNRIMSELDGKIVRYFKESAELLAEFGETQTTLIRRTAGEMIRALENGARLLICGNGGSAADSQHFAAELVGRFLRDRRPLPAIALSTDTSILTSVANDYSFDDVFSRQVEALGTLNDVLVVLSTSGNSPNIINAVNTAKSKQLLTIALLGKGGGKVAGLVDLALVVPSQRSQCIQQIHIAVIHMWCELIEDVLFPK